MAFIETKFLKDIVENSHLFEMLINIQLWLYEEK